MLTETELGEYLSEIRDQVCSRCVERPPGGPPCAPLGKNCGVEMHLPLLIESIHEVHSNLLAPYLDHNRKMICEKCALLHSSICPCPMDYLSALIVETVETVDQRRAERDLERKAEPPVPGRPKAGIEEVRRAYEQGKGTWTGCDWPTHFGKSGLDLEGWHAVEARITAEDMEGAAAAEDWHDAARWLAQIEQHAKWAEAQAASAVAAAAAGRWTEALQLAEQAWALEFGTGRAIWHSFPLAWNRLLQATQAAFLSQPVNEAIKCV